MIRRKWVIGRSCDCDLIVDDAAVSSRHCQLTQTPDGFVLEDLNSTNGTFVNGKQVHSQVQVTPADHITLGLKLPLPWPPGIGRVGQRSKEKKNPNFDRLTIPRPGKRIVFGRDPNCDQVLDYPMISRRHAQLSNSADGLFVEDLGSSNGTFLNGRRVRRAIKIHAGDLIGLGTFSFRLTGEGQLEKRDSRGNVTLEAREITVDVPGARLLEGVSLTIYPGEIVALMGPAGAGKTTLMSALNGYLPPSGGEVLLNGQSLYGNYSQFSTCLGYLPQDDIMHRELTVRQALYFTARLRLPTDYSAADIEDRIKIVMKQLWLEDIQNKIIGSPERKVISGGQRKRVNLAMELLTDPLVLFLDEPTTGLSSEDTLMVMKVLRSLADSGKTILLTIHQPGLEAFRLMDNLAVVSRDVGTSAPAKLVYYGHAYPDAIHFFNPDGIPDSKPGVDPAPDEALRGLSKRKTAEWADLFATSKHQRKFVEERVGTQSLDSAPITPQESAGIFEVSRLWTLVRRSLAIKAKDTLNTAILLAQAPIVAILIVIVFSEKIREAITPENWFQVSDSLSVAVFLLALAALWFGCSNSVREIVGEWAIYHRERMVNLRITSYVLSKFIILGSLCIIQCAILLGIVYWLCEFQGNVFAMFGILFLASIVGVAIGLTLSAIARTTEIAIAFLPIILLPMVILGGILQPVHKMNQVVQIISNGMASRWAFEGLLLLETENRDTLSAMIPGNDGKSLPFVENKAAPPKDMAEKFFPKDSDRFGIVISITALLVLLGIFFVAVHVILRRRDVH